MRKYKYHCLRNEAIIILVIKKKENEIIFEEQIDKEKALRLNGPLNLSFLKLNKITSALLREFFNY